VKWRFDQHGGSPVPARAEGGESDAFPGVDAAGADDVDVVQADARAFSRKALDQVVR
jgi:hypothetical protein